MNNIKKVIPNRLRRLLSEFRANYRRSFIESAVGSLSHTDSDKTFLMIVGPTFDERRPDAMMVARQGYCNAFEQIGIPYLIVDIRDLPKALSKIENPFCMLYSSDLGALSSSARISRI